MDPRIEAALDEWRFRACDPGYAGLHALADAEFTGAVTTGETVGFMVNGRLVGLSGGTTESFWGTDFTALEAEGPALPLLCAMLESSAQEEGEYYTGETPITEVDEMLSSGSFTGYLELSENVFSGDYFSIYYGGTSFNAAFLGTEDRILTGDEAKHRAAEEVGIYTVNSVSIDVVDIPDPEVDDSANQERDDEDAIEPEPVEDEPTTSPTPSTRQESTTPPPTREQEQGQEIARLATSSLSAKPATVSGSPSAAAQPATKEWIAIPSLDPDRSGGVESPATAVEEQEPEPEPVDNDLPQEPEPPEEDTVPASELEALEEENERLQERIEELKEEITKLETEESSAETLAQAGALDGTNLFVRYATKSNYTLDHAIEGEASRDDVTDNLQLEWHTTFATEDLEVEGVPYETFLQQSTSYRFSEWVLTELLFELIESGEVKGFTALLEIVPDIDRIEFRGEVPIHTQEGGDRQSHTYGFDLVFRNSMGDPVFVAQVHDSRTPVNGDAVAELLEDANTIAAERSSLVGAFFVGSSYFEPAALETVADATGGGLFRGGSRTSYVSVSRKNGFHLCLVEARNGSFHLNIPDN